MSEIRNLKELTAQGRLNLGDTLYFKTADQEFKYNVLGSYLSYTGDNGIIFKYLSCGITNRHVFARNIYTKADPSTIVDKDSTQFPEYANMTQAYAIAKVIYEELETKKPYKLSKIKSVKKGELTEYGVVVGFEKDFALIVDQKGGIVKKPKNSLVVISTTQVLKKYKESTDVTKLPEYTGEKLYKVVTRDKQAFHSTHYQFGDDWEPVVEKVAMCEKGYHVCKANELKEWEGTSPIRRVWEVKARGKVEFGSSKAVCQTIKLVRLVPFSEVLTLAYGSDYK